MGILNAIQVAYSNMTKTERKVADFILGENDGHYFLHVTLNQLACEADVGQATVMRMINACGYSSYRAFMADLSQALYQNSAQDLMKRKAGNTLVEDWSDILQICQSSIDPELLRLSAETICHADFVICMGYGNSNHIAALAASHFRRIGLVATQNIPGEISYSTDIFSPKMRAVVLVFSITGETPEVIRIAKEYAESGVCVIALTGRSESSLAKLANITFFTPSRVAGKKYGRWLDGMVSQLFVVETLAAEVNKNKYAKEPER